VVIICFNGAPFSFVNFTASAAISSLLGPFFDDKATADGLKPSVANLLHGLKKAWAILLQDIETLANTALRIFASVQHDLMQNDSI
jgi:hypothetical protein